VRWRITISDGMPSAFSVSRSKASGSIVWSPARCSFMSMSALARYSTVAKPWLNVAARSILCTSSAGMGFPVW
jgi:hypothetical protein